MHRSQHIIELGTLNTQLEGQYHCLELYFEQLKIGREGKSMQTTACTVAVMSVLTAALDDHTDVGASEFLRVEGGYGGIGNDRPLRQLSGAGEAQITDSPRTKITALSRICVTRYAFEDHMLFRGCEEIAIAINSSQKLVEIEPERSRKIPCRARTKRVTVPPLCHRELFSPL